MIQPSSQILGTYYALKQPRLLYEAERKGVGLYLSSKEADRRVATIAIAMVDNEVVLGVVRHRVSNGMNDDVYYINESMRYSMFQASTVASSLCSSSNFSLAPPTDELFSESAAPSALSLRNLFSTLTGFSPFL